MTSPQAILVGAALIAATIFLVNTIGPAQAQHDGPFQLMHHSNTTGNAGVFKIDVSTGDVSYCYISGDASASLICSRPVR